MTPDRAPSPLTKHPAPYSPSVLDAMRAHVRREARALGRRPRLLDPMAGVGRVHQLDSIADTRGVELQPRWAACHQRTRCGDATRLPHWWTGRFDIVAVSPVYGNRMSDHHNAKDKCKKCDGSGYDETTTTSFGRAILSDDCKACGGSGLSSRRSYTHDYGEPLEPNNAGVLTFGSAEYAALHVKAWRQVRRVMRPDGLFLLNVSDFVRDFELVPVVAWHLDAVRALGFRLVRSEQIATPRMRKGANREARASSERLLVLRKGT